MRRWLGGIVLVVVHAAAANAAPFAWLAHPTVDKLARVDLATHETVSVGVGSGPATTAASDDGLRAYTVDQFGSTVTVVDGPTVTVVTTIPLASTPRNVAARRDGAKAYVGLDDGTVVVIDGVTDTILTTISLGSPAFFGAIVTNAANTRAYVTKSDGNVQSVGVIDTVNDTFIADVFLTIGNGFPLGVAVSPDGTRVYATFFNTADVFAIDATTNLAMPSIPLSTGFGSPQPNGLGVAPDGTRLYVAEEFVDRLAVVDTATATELTSVAVGSQPTVVDVTPDGSRAYVVNSGDSTLSILDTGTDTIVGTVLTVDDFPLAGERFIAPGTSTTTTSTTSSTAPTTSSTTSTTLVTTTTTGAASTSSTSSSTLPPPPLLSTAAISCQKTLALSFKRFGAKAHGIFVACFQRVLSAVASGTGTSGATSACLADLNPAAPTSKILRLRTAARNQIVARCAALTPADLAQPCDPAATTITALADCVLDAQVDRVASAVAAEYGRPCSIATVAGLAATYPSLCP